MRVEEVADVGGVGAVLVDPLDGGRSSRVLNLELRLSRLHTEVMH